VERLLVILTSILKTARKNKTLFHSFIISFFHYFIYNCMISRSSGILLHPTSLPGKYGIGSLGAEARSFVDWLSESGQKIWQILPLGPTDFSHSPYQCYSAFAGNADLIDLDELVQSGLIKDDELVPLKAFPLESIDYHSVRKFREPHLHNAFLRFRETGGFGWDNYLTFWNENAVVRVVVTFLCLP